MVCKVQDYVVSESKSGRRWLLTELQGAIYHSWRSGKFIGSPTFRSVVEVIWVRPLHRYTYIVFT